MVACPCWARTSKLIRRCCDHPALRCKSSATSDHSKGQRPNQATVRGHSGQNPVCMGVVDGLTEVSVNLPVSWSRTEEEEGDRLRSTVTSTNAQDEQTRFIRVELEFSLRAKGRGTERTPRGPPHPPKRRNGGDHTSGSWHVREGRALNKPQIFPSSETCDLSRACYPRIPPCAQTASLTGHHHHLLLVLLSAIQHSALS